jgi:hypothetical protein
VGKKKKYRGHFCWCCERVLANERFSGSGHARHLCKQCSKLGADELEYRQGVRNIHRTLDWNGRVRRKHREQFEHFLSHSNDRVRRYAEEIAAKDARIREALRDGSTAEDNSILTSMPPRHSSST